MVVRESAPVHESLSPEVRRTSSLLGTLKLARRAADPPRAEAHTTRTKQSTMPDSNDTPTSTDAPAAPPRSRRRARRAWTAGGFVLLLVVVALVAQVAGTSGPARTPITVKPLLGVPVPTKDSTRVATTSLKLATGHGVRVTGSATLTKAATKPATAHAACAIVGSRDGDRGWTPVELPETLGRDPRQQVVTLTNAAPKKILRFSTVVNAPADDTYRLHVACGVTGAAAKVTALGAISTAAVTA
jgi:hypothetical protein